MMENQNFIFRFCQCPLSGMDEYSLVFNRISCSNNTNHLYSEELTYWPNLFFIGRILEIIIQIYFTFQNMRLVCNYLILKMYVV